MNLNDLQEKNWEIVPNGNCDYCPKGSLMIMGVIRQDETLGDFDPEMRDWHIEQGHFEARVQCKYCNRYSMRWVKETV